MILPNPFIGSPTWPLRSAHASGWYSWVHSVSAFGTARHSLRVGVPGENAVQVGQRLLKDFRRNLRLAACPPARVMQPTRDRRGEGCPDKSRHRIGRRLALESPEERSVINSPADAAALVAYEMSALEQECDDLTQRSIAHSMSQNWDGKFWGQPNNLDGKPEGKIAFGKAEWF